MSPYSFYFLGSRFEGYAMPPIAHAVPLAWTITIRNVNEIMIPGREIQWKIQCLNLVGINNCVRAKLSFSNAEDEKGRWNIVAVLYCWMLAS